MSTRESSGNVAPMTNRDRLTLLAEAIFGPRWQNATARALGVNTRQVHRWVSGEYQPSDAVIRRLISLARQKRADIDAAIRAAHISSDTRSSDFVP